MAQTSCYDNPNERQYIWTYTGRKMFFDAPTKDMVSIQDIAHALSNLCRWSGQTFHFYSIAQHCVLVSRYQETLFPLEKLLHDASEAYTGDICKPLKNVMGPTFAEIETRLTTAVSMRYGIKLHDPEVHKAVKDADMAIALAEAKQLMNQDMIAPGYRAAGVKIEHWSPTQAEDMFLARFKELM